MFSDGRLVPSINPHPKRGRGKEGPARNGKRTTSGHSHRGLPGPVTMALRMDAGLLQPLIDMEPLFHGDQAMRGKGRMNDCETVERGSDPFGRRTHDGENKKIAETSHRIRSKAQTASSLTQQQEESDTHTHPESRGKSNNNGNDGDPQGLWNIRHAGTRVRGQCGFAKAPPKRAGGASR